jgi:hypothetical protein
VIRNDLPLRFQLKRGLNRLRMRAREALAGAQPEWRPDITETPAVADSDDHTRDDGHAPAAPEPDRIIPLVIYHRPWVQPSGQTAGMTPEK